MILIFAYIKLTKPWFVLWKHIISNMYRISKDQIAVLANVNHCIFVKEITTNQSTLTSGRYVLQCALMLRDDYNCKAICISIPRCAKMVFVVSGDEIKIINYGSEKVKRITRTYYLHYSVIWKTPISLLCSVVNYSIINFSI